LLKSFVERRDVDMASPDCVESYKKPGLFR